MNTPSSATHRTTRTVQWLPWIAALLAVVGVAPSLAGGFVLDDTVAVLNSPCVRSAFDPWRIVTSNFWCEPGPEYSIESWRPWPVFVWWCIHALGLGESALPFHALNVLLHLACTLSVYRLGLDLALPRRAAGWGAVVFASLAIHVDAVASIVGAAELWSALFVLQALRAFMRGRWWWCIPFATLAVASKESGVLVVPLLVVVAVFTPRSRQSDETPSSRAVHRPRGRTVLTLVGVTLVALAMLAVRAEVLGAWTSAHIPAHVNPLVDAGFTTRLVAAFAIVGRYHLLALRGSPLSADYAHAAIGVGDDVAWGDVGMGAAVVFGTLLVVWKLRARPQAALLGLWLLGTCLFISNLPFVLPAIFAERLFYLPSVALALLAGWGASAALDSPYIRTKLVLALLVVFVAGQTLHALVHAWRYTDALHLIETTVASTPNNARARMWLAQRQVKAGDHEAARVHAEAAARIRPDWGAPLALLGVIEDMQGKPEAALPRFRTAMQLDPADSDVANHFIVFLLRYGHDEPARAVYERHTAARGTPHPSVTVP